MKTAIVPIVFGILSLACAGDWDESRDSSLNSSTLQDGRVSIPELGLSLVIPERFRQLYPDDVDSLKRVVVALYGLGTPCEEVYKGMETHLMKANIMGFYDSDDVRNNVIISVHAKTSFTREQAENVMSSICPNLFAGFKIKILGVDEVAHSIGRAIRVKAYISGPEWDYLSTAYILQGQRRNYMLTFNSVARDESQAMVESVKELDGNVRMDFSFTDYLNKIGVEADDLREDSLEAYFYRIKEYEEERHESYVFMVRDVCLLEISENVEVQSGPYRQFSGYTISKIAKLPSDQVWLQQRGLNSGRIEAAKTYFRFSVRKYYDDDTGEELTWDDADEASLRELNDEYMRGIVASYTLGQRVLEVYEPEVVSFGPYQALLLSHMREYQGNRTVSSRYLVVDGTRMFIVESGYRKEHEGKWKPELDRILKSMVLL